MMKKCILLLALLSCAFGVNAQSRKDVLLGGSFHYQKTSDADEVNNIEITHRELSIFTREGIFISENFAIGLLGGYGNSKELRPSPSNNQELTTKGLSITAGVFARYYKFIGEEKKLAFIAEPQVKRSWSRSTTFVYKVIEDITQTTAGSDINRYDFALEPSIAYFFTKKFSLEMKVASIGYYKSRQGSGLMSSGEASTTRSFYANIDLMHPQLGVMFCL
jgi:hypothetical protein